MFYSEKKSQPDEKQLKQNSTEQTSNKTNDSNRVEKRYGNPDGNERYSG